jgi:hypothetical protein
VNLALTAARHRVPFLRGGPLSKIVPGFVGQAANTGTVVEER